MKYKFIDTHTHIDGEEFLEDLDEVIARAKEAGAEALLVPGINEGSISSIRTICEKYPGYCYGMIGLHPEDVKADYNEVLDRMMTETSPTPSQGGELETCSSNLETVIKTETDTETPYHKFPSLGGVRGGIRVRGGIIAIGEVGLDYYWSREFEAEQLKAFERQVQWSISTRLPLMIHCRKAQNEMVKLLRKYEKDLPGGVFHCFTGNVHEAEELLAFNNFVLGIGGVLTFKKSNLPDTLANAVPLSRIVLETDAPYMAPVPHRGKRNESAYITHIIDKLAEVYNTTPEEVATATTQTARRLFNI